MRRLAWIALAAAVALVAGCGKKEDPAPKAEPAKASTAAEPLKDAEGQQRRVPCEPVTIRSLMLRSCYAAVP